MKKLFYIVSILCAIAYAKYYPSEEVLVLSAQSWNTIGGDSIYYNSCPSELYGEDTSYYSRCALDFSEHIYERAQTTMRGDEVGDYHHFIESAEELWARKSQCRIFERCSNTNDMLKFVADNYETGGILKKVGDNREWNSLHIWKAGPDCMNFLVDFKKGYWKNKWRNQAIEIIFFTRDSIAVDTLKISGSGFFGKDKQQFLNMKKKGQDGWTIKGHRIWWIEINVEKKPCIDGYTFESSSGLCIPNDALRGDIVKIISHWGSAGRGYGEDFTCKNVFRHIKDVYGRH